MASNRPGKEHDSDDTEERRSPTGGFTLPPILPDSDLQAWLDDFRRPPPIPFIPFMMEKRTEPSKEEQLGYFFGLGSCPKLVARTSTDRWQQRCDGGVTLGKKLSSPGNKHPIIMWNDSDGSLRQDIMKALGASYWTAVDILRVGYEDSPKYGPQEQPITMLLSVTPGSTRWIDGQFIVDKCREILQQHNITDVHCEMMESRVISANSSDVPMPIGHNLYTRKSHLIGLSIGPSWGARYGTKGLYLRQRGDSKIFALVCRHVVFSDDEDSETDYQHGAGGVTLEMVQPDAERLGIEIEKAQAEEEFRQRELDSLSGKDSVGSQTIEKYKASLEEARQYLQDLKGLETTNSRVFGRVTFSPPMSIIRPGPRNDTTSRPTKAFRWLRDWAIVELDEDKHSSTLSDLTNDVFVGNSQHVHSVIEPAILSVPGTKWELSPAGNHDHVRLAGVVPETEIRSLPWHSPTGEAKMVVAKQGAATGLTVGYGSTILSITRVGRDELGYSERWSILNHGSSVFSDEGDSGACIWDLKGRVAGIVLEVNGIGRDNTMTYAIPFEPLLDDIRSHGFDVELA